MASSRLDAQSLPPESSLAAIMASRSERFCNPITFEHDGRTLSAFEGEPLAIALLANGVGTLARSVKFHRPRGPSCLRGACDGCLTRVNGVPNVMACRAAA